MVASGAKILPHDANEARLARSRRKGSTDQAYHDMWTEGLVPASAQADTAELRFRFPDRQNRHPGHRRLPISLLKDKFARPRLRHGVLPGIEAGQQSAFVGGDVIAIPKGSKNEDVARKFIAWELTDEAQLEGLAKNKIIPSRTDLATNKYFTDERVGEATAKAVGVGYVPWVFHFNDMVNSNSSPWIQMLQTGHLRRQDRRGDRRPPRQR